ncbi:jg20141 [Pararge aegeria aegeria]|uniref:Jg20141 protein n=1 Tax=Pararge aegeria aegeria TaxID=348720 RepID=A0A8S4S8G7_9NEOP|nr:jg20141 [Pararge aegeria aegeria]
MTLPDVGQQRYSAIKSSAAIANHRQGIILPDSGSGRGYGGAGGANLRVIAGYQKPRVVWIVRKSMDKKKKKKKSLLHIQLECQVSKKKTIVYICLKYDTETGSSAVGLARLGGDRSAVTGR